jgi:hypothetical protein
MDHGENKICTVKVFLYYTGQLIRGSYEMISFIAVKYTCSFCLIHLLGS